MPASVFKNQTAQYGFPELLISFTPWVLPCSSLGIKYLMTLYGINAMPPQTFLADILPIQQRSFCGLQRTGKANITLIIR